MVVFLLYRFHRSHHADPLTVGNRLRLIFEPLFQQLPPADVVCQGSLTLISFSKRVRRWNAPLVEEDEQSSVVAPNYPIDAEDCLRSRGLLAPGEGVLPALARALQRDPQPLLRELAPPFSLIWQDKRAGEIWLQNDALGQAPLFEYQDESVWAITNRPLALRAVGARLEPVPAEWAVRITLGWFPMDLTGFRRVGYVRPGS